MQDAQEFLDSVKKLNNEEKEETPKEVPSFIPERAKVFFPDFGTSFWPQKEIEHRKEHLTFIEVHYQSTGKLPSKADFENNFTPARLPKTDDDWKHLLLSFQEALEARGIPPYETPLEYLEPLFVYAVGLICNPYDKRSLPAKLKEAGLSTRQWQAFLRKPAQQEYFQNRLQTIFDEDTQNDAKLALQSLIANKDLQAIKYYNELQNIYRPQATLDVSIILRAMMEILAKHVESAVLSKVAAELSSAS